MSVTTTRSEQSALSLSPAQRSVAEALAKNPEATVVALTEASGTSKSTTTKTLIKLEAVGAARRTLHEDGDIRLADTWSPTELTRVALEVTAAKESSEAHVEEGWSIGDHALAPASSGSVGPEPGSDAEVTTACLEGADPVAAAGSPAASAFDDLQGAASDDVDAEDEGTSEGSEQDIAADNSLAAETPYAEVLGSARSEPPAALESSQAVASAGVPVGPSGGRLAPGALATMVANHLAANPEREFTPTELSRLLGGRSSGAIYNVLVKMQGASTAVQTCQSPRRYRYASGLTAA